MWKDRQADIENQLPEQPVHEHNESLSTSDIVIAIVIFIAMLFLVPAISLLSVRFTSDFWYLMDEGTILYAAHRSSLGELPHIDTAYFYSGGFEILLGYVFNMFGSTLAVARWTLGVNMAATASLVYLICRRISIDWSVAAGFAVIATGLGYGMNFHIYPAWYSGTLLLIAVLFMWKGMLQRERWLWICLAGVCLGIASSLKQTSGLYGLFSFMLWVLIVTGRLPFSTARSMKHSPALLKIGATVLLSIPITILVFFVLILRSHLTLLNIAMFLTVPAIMLLYGINTVIRKWKDSPDVAGCFVSEAVQKIAALVFGAGLGLLPIFLLYIVRGGFLQFVGDSFLNIEQVAAARYSVFKFVDEAAMSNAIVFVRWLILFIAPIITALISFYVVIRKNVLNNQHQLILLISILIAVLYLTLYPIAIRMYVLFLLPLVIIAIAYCTDVILKRISTSPPVRLFVVLGMFVIIVTAYVGSRSLAGDLGRISAGAGDVGLLDQERGNVYVPKTTINYLHPVLEYLENRPQEESVVALDMFTKLVAFVSNRKIEVDYWQRHYFNEITADDFLDLKHLIEERTIDIIVIGKNHLTNARSESMLFEFLAKKYTLALDNQTHLVYQRIPG